MASKNFSVEIKFDENVELGTAVLFFQKLVTVLAKFGLTYFKDAILYMNYKELARYETSSTMSFAIKEFQEEKFAQQVAKDKETQEVN